MSNLNRLVCFNTFAQKGALSAAATELSINPTALSTKLKELEADLGVKLIKRGAHGYALTDIGRDLFEKTKNAFNLLDASIDELKNQLLARQVCIGVSDQIDPTFLYKFISQATSDLLPTERPQTKLIPAPYIKMIEALNSGQTNLAVSLQPYQNTKIGIHHRLDIPVVFASNKGPAFPLMTQNTSNWLSKNQSGFILPPEDSLLRKQTELFFEQIQYRPKAIFEAKDIQSMIRSIVSGAGIGLVPLSYIEDEVATNSLSVFAPHGGYWLHSIWLLGLRNTENKPTPFTFKFQQLFGDSFKEISFI